MISSFTRRSLWSTSSSWLRRWL